MKATSHRSNHKLEMVFVLSFLVVLVGGLFTDALFAQGQVGGKAPTSAGDGAIVQVNNDVILNSDVLSRIRPKLRQMAQRLPREQFRKQQRALFLKSVSTMIKENVLKQEAKEQGLSVSEERIEQIKQTQIEKAGSKRAFRRGLYQQGFTLDMWERKVRTDLLSQKLFQKQLRESGSSSFVTPDEMRSYYENNKEKFYNEAEVKGHIISFPFNSTDERDKRVRQALSVVDQLETGASFQSLVDAYSDLDPEHTRSFDWTKKGNFLKPIEYVLFHRETESLRIGPFVAGDRVVIIKRTGLIKAKQKKLTNPEVQKQIRQQIKQRKRRKKHEQMRERLLQEAYINPRYLLQS